MGQNTKTENRVTDKLTDLTIKKAKSKEKPYKLSDGKGLRLVVNPNGGKWWRFYYQFDDKEKTLSFGTYPEITLSDAREKRNVARKMIANGIDPGAARKEEKAVRLNTFENVAREWHRKHLSEWTPGHAHTMIRWLELNIFPTLGGKSIKDISPVQILGALRIIEQRGL